MRHLIRSNRFATTARLAWAVMALTLMGGVYLLANTCLPIVNPPINVDGVVVGAAAGAVSGCSADPAWGGSIGQNFVVFGTPGTVNGKLFLASHQTSANLDHLYLGIHVENDVELTSDDKLTLYFDINGDGTFGAQDFALTYEVGPLAPPSTEACNQAVNNVTFYQISGGSWAQTALPAAIASQTSWDYQGTAPGDAETNIWELEIGVDLTALGVTVSASGSHPRIGAKLYVKEAGDLGTVVFRWPTGLTSDANPTHASNPNNGSVTPATLETMDVGTCGFDVKFESVTATDGNGNTGKFTRYVAGDFGAGGSLDPGKRNKFVAKVTFLNPANPTDTSPVAVPNTGKVAVLLKPWNGDFLGEVPVGDPTISFTHLAETQTVSLNWPPNKATWDANSSDFNSSDHTCLKVDLSGFPVNTDLTNDHFQQNLFYTTLSTIRDSFLISARRQESPGNQPIEYILRARWQNVPPGKVFLGKPACPNCPIKKDFWNYRFLNAAALGLKDLGKGYFSLLLKPGEEKRVEVSISGGPMPIKTQQLKLSPRAGGKASSPGSGEAPLEMPVKEGMMVTIVANGLINTAPQNKRILSNGPIGFSDRELQSQKFLLPRDLYAPWQNIGAVIGSFDGFKTAFLIGGDATFIVPAGASKLWIAVNDVLGAYNDNVGNGFILNVALSNPVILPTRLAATPNPKFGQPAIAAPGSNLPKLDFDVMIRQPQIKLLRPTGYVSYAVYATHVGTASSRR